MYEAECQFINLHATYTFSSLERLICICYKKKYTINNPKLNSKSRRQGLKTPRNPLQEKSRDGQD